jgi:hypothetical protein
MLTRRVGSIAVIHLAIVAAADVRARQRVPEGFRKLTEDFWDSPWVFDQRGRALRRLESSRGQLRNRSLSMRLDDGSQAILQVHSKDDEQSGCTAKGECYWVEVTDRQGKILARRPLWATYGRFDIVPADLVDGPGDELIIITIPTRSSPPAGYEINIWKIGETKPVELIEPLRLAGVFASNLIGCARWRSRVIVDATSSKPRAVTLRSEFAATASGYFEGAVCRLHEEEFERLTTLKRDQVLRFVR